MQISEEQIKEILNNILAEQSSKVSRQDFSRVQFKIDELQLSLNETIKELRKLDDALPGGLKTISNARIRSISLYLNNAQKLISQLKVRVVEQKKKMYQQPSDEKKKIG